MGVTIISPRLAKIEPDRVTGQDILELAEAYIREYGHLKGDSGDKGRGFSIHGAINAATEGVTATSKDSSSARPLRDEATELVLAQHPGQTDLTLNDSHNYEEVLAILRAAREEEPDGE